MLFWCRNCHASCIDPLLSSRQLWLLRVFCDPTHPSSNVYAHTWLIISITIWMQVPTEAKRTSDPLELEWQVVVSHPWILGTKPRSLSRTVMALNDWAISQAPFPLLKALEFKYTHTHTESVGHWVELAISVWIWTVFSLMYVFDLFLSVCNFHCRGHVLCWLNLFPGLVLLFYFCAAY